MSASQEKKVRKQLREEGLDKNQIAQQKAEKALKRKHRNTSIFVTIVAVIIVAAITWSSNLFYTNFTALKVGDTSYTAGEYNFFYNSTARNYISQASSYITYIGLDSTKSFDEQPYFADNTKTWADYFKETAQDSMKQITAFYNAAQEAGFKLSDADQAILDTNLKALDTCYEGSDYSNADTYLSAYYGKGVTKAVVADIYTKSSIASAYSTQMNDSFTYNSEDLEKYYTENKDNLDQYTYISYLVDGSVPEPSIDTTAASVSPEATTASPSESPDTTALKEVAMANAKKIAEAIVADTTTADSFKKAVLAQTTKEASETTTKGSELTAAFADWLKDASRTEGDSTVIATETGYYALYYISRDDNNYKTVNVRHILIKAVADEAGAYTDEAKATAKTKAESLLKEWKAGDKTEDSFATIANANSEDGGSNTNGGLYENVYKNQMVPEFNDWCYAAGRKTGDTGIVFNEGSYCGYHVIYYVNGEGKTYRETLAETGARDKDFTAWKDSVLANYEVTTGFTAKLLEQSYK